MVRFFINKWTLFILLICLNSFIPTVFALTDTQYQKLFSQARSHINDSDLKEYYQLKAKLKNYSLYPYLRYLEIINHFDDFSSQTIENYLKENKDTIWAKLLKSQWLNYLGRNGIWDIYVKYGSDSQTMVQKCWYVQSIYEEESTEKALKQFDKLWLYGRSLPRACDFMLSKWQGTKYDTELLRMKRIQLAMDADQYSLAQYLSYRLDKSDQEFVQAWADAMVDPHFSLKPFLKSYMDHEAFSNAFIKAWKHFANEDPLSAVKLYNQIEKQIPENLRGDIQANIAMGLARDHLPSAFIWLKKVPDENATSLLWQWRARTAILWEKWPQLVEWINKMPDDLNQKLQWQYWLAVGLYHTKDKTKADEIWQKLAKERDYYGFLAADQIGAPYNLKTKHYTVSKQLLAEVENYPEIKQIYQLYQLKEYNLADYYWRWALKRYNRYQALAAAEIAHKWQINSMAIYAYGRSKYYDDLTHRFPLAYKNDILKYAKMYDINPAWVWALTRQESHFNPIAVSSANAYGLMQLLPSTASFISSKYKIPYRGQSSLFDPSVNIQLGIANLSHVYDNLEQNIVLATAAYNAGYGNVRSWLPQNTLKASRWIESVPFLETRQYLRRVLTYTIIYENVMLKDNVRLKDITQKVKPKS